MHLTVWNVIPRKHAPLTLQVGTALVFGVTGVEESPVVIRLQKMKTGSKKASGESPTEARWDYLLLDRPSGLSHKLIWCLVGHGYMCFIYYVYMYVCPFQ